MPNNSATVTVRLRRSVTSFGRKGALVPVPRGQMRNEWFPRGIAEYVTAPELKTLRINKVAMERDYGFGLQSRAVPKQTGLDLEAGSMSSAELKSASAFNKVEVKRLSPERSGELVELFVGPRIEFYRQPIIEELEVKSPESLVEGTGAAADLMAARRPVAKPVVRAGPTPIYGSVSALDVLQAVRATMARNDEAARVVLHEEDIQFVDLPETEHSEAGKVKHVGDFTVEIKVRGVDTVMKRTVRVIPQDSQPSSSA
jgi:hypothetical protein